MVKITRWTKEFSFFVCTGTVCMEYIALFVIVVISFSSSSHDFEWNEMNLWHKKDWTLVTPRVLAIEYKKFHLIDVWSEYFSNVFNHFSSQIYARIWWMTFVWFPLFPCVMNSLTIDQQKRGWIAVARETASVKVNNVPDITSWHKNNTILLNGMPKYCSAFEWNVDIYAAYASFIDARNSCYGV